MKEETKKKINKALGDLITKWIERPKVPYEHPLPLKPFKPRLTDYIFRRNDVAFSWYLWHNRRQKYRTNKLTPEYYNINWTTMKNHLSFLSDCIQEANRWSPTMKMETMLIQARQVYYTLGEYIEQTERMLKDKK
jgi:hypothetical protein